MDRIENEQESDYLLHEWRKISRIFDNFFFLVILLSTFCTTFFLLVFAPRFSQRDLIEESLHKMRDGFGRLD